MDAAMIMQLLQSNQAKLQAIIDAGKQIIELPTATPGVKRIAAYNEESRKTEQVLLSDNNNSDAPANSFISLGPIVVNENILTIQNGVLWVYNGIFHEIPGNINFTINYAAVSFSRIDLLVATSAGEISLITGPESVGLAVSPAIPAESLVITSILVTSSTINISPTDPSIMRLKNVQQREFWPINVAGFSPIINLNDFRGTFIIDEETAEIHGFNRSENFINYYSYPHKQLRISNRSGSDIILKHNHGASNLKLHLPENADITLSNNEDVVFHISQDNARFDFVTRISSGGSADQDNKPKSIYVVYSGEPTKENLATAVNASEFVGDELEVIHFLGFKLGSRDNEIDRIVRFRVLGRGKGTYTDVTASNIDIMSVTVMTAEEIEGLPNTQTIDLGEIGTALVSDALNAFELTTIADPDSFYIWVKGGVNRDYKFIGAPGDYGVGGTLTATEADFEWIPSQNGTNDTPNQHVEISLSDLGVATFSEVTGEMVEAYIMANVPYLQAQNLEVTVVEGVEDVFDIDFKANNLVANGITDQASFESYTSTTVENFSLVGEHLQCDVLTNDGYLALSLLSIYELNNCNVFGVQDLTLSYNQITSIDNATFNDNLQGLDLNYNQLTSINNIPWNNNLQSLGLSNNQLLSVNEVLIWADANPNIIYLRLEGGTNAAPTGAGITAKNSLISKGVTVITN